MKNISMLFCAGMLMGALCVVFVACNEPKDNYRPEPPEVIGTVHVPVSGVSDIPEDVAAFFKQHLPPNSYSYPAPEFGFGKIDFRDTECFMINSMEEFRAVAPPYAELPAVDFGKHTLIIGQHWMGNPGYTLEKQSVGTESDEMTLSLVYNTMKATDPLIMTIHYFWGLYPKLPEKPVAIDITVLEIKLP